MHESTIGYTEPGLLQRSRSAGLTTIMQAQVQKWLHFNYRMHMRVYTTYAEQEEQLGLFKNAMIWTWNLTWSWRLCIKVAWMLCLRLRVTVHPRTGISHSQ